METKAHHVLIGAFVLLTLIGGLVFALWIARVSLDAEFDEYDVVFNETVTGLTKGAAVNFNGIQVGEVRRLSLDRDNAARVLARIRVGSDTPIKTDTTARLTYTGLTGVAIIELVAGKPDALPLVAADGEFAVIQALPSAFQKIMNDGGDVLVRFNEALSRVTEVLSVENTERISNTLAHIEAVSAQIDSDKASLGAALRQADVAFADIRTAAADFDAFVDKADGTLAKVDQLMQDDVGPAAADLKRTLASLREIGARIDTLLARNGAQIDQLAQKGLPGLTATLEDLRAVAQSLNRITEKLDAGPAAYLLQRDRPREYKPK